LLNAANVFHYEASWSCVPNDLEEVEVQLVSRIVKPLLSGEGNP